MFNKSIALLHTHTQTHTNSSILFDFLEEIPFFNRGRRSNSVKFQRTPLGRRAHSDACAARPNCRPFLFGRVEKLAKAVGTPPPAICKIMTAAWKECIMRDISRLRAPRGASAAPPPLRAANHPPTCLSAARPMHYRYTANTCPATVHEFHGNFVIGLASLVLPPSSSFSVSRIASFLRRWNYVRRVLNKEMESLSMYRLNIA